MRVSPPAKTKVAPPKPDPPKPETSKPDPPKSDPPKSSPDTTPPESESNSSPTPRPETVSANPESPESESYRDMVDLWDSKFEPEAPEKARELSESLDGVDPATADHVMGPIRALFGLSDSQQTMEIAEALAPHLNDEDVAGIGRHLTQLEDRLATQPDWRQGWPEAKDDPLGNSTLGEHLEDRNQMVDTLMAVYQNHPDPEVRERAGVTLREQAQSYWDDSLLTEEGNPDHPYVEQLKDWGLIEPSKLEEAFNSKAPDQQGPGLMERAEGLLTRFQEQREELDKLEKFESEILPDQAPPGSPLSEVLDKNFDAWNERFGTDFHDGVLSSDEISNALTLGHDQLSSEEAAALSALREKGGDIRAEDLKELGIEMEDFYALRRGLDPADTAKLEKLRSAREAWQGVEEAALQTGADILGLADPVGVAEIPSLALSVKNGDAAGTVLSLAGAVPFLGEAAEGLKAGRALNKLDKALDRVGLPGRRRDFDALVDEVGLPETTKKGFGHARGHLDGTAELNSKIAKVERGKKPTHSWFNTQEEMDAAILEARERLPGVLSNDPDKLAEFDAWMESPTEGNLFGFAFPVDRRVGDGLKYENGKAVPTGPGNEVYINYKWVRQGNDLIPQVYTVFPRNR